ncbi:hypothetical protein [Nocardia sp. CY41]|uniref:hypothetical protein n=1 Tax=Nocardia sp. CY41 TaxID=2608686 RepID=UPI001358C04B|nr:hypothetical protein [Nocardia sp. CY41]
MEQRLVAGTIEIEPVECLQRDVYRTHAAFRLGLAELEAAAAVFPRLADAHRTRVGLDVTHK